MRRNGSRRQNWSIESGDRPSSSAAGLHPPCAKMAIERSCPTQSSTTRQSLATNQVHKPAVADDRNLLSPPDTPVGIEELGAAALTDHERIRLTSNNE